MASAAVVAPLIKSKGCGQFGYKAYIWILTFLCYTSYHLSRKPITVVTNVLHNATCYNESGMEHPDCYTNWKPFGNENYVSALDYSYLFAYAIGMFVSGHVAERMDLRYFLTLGMVSSGVLTASFGLGYIFKIHSLVFYICVQIITGFGQSTGWPAVVTIMGNWYGKSRRGFIMGIWNSHTSLGNILGSLIASAFLNHYWEPRGYWTLSFMVCGIIIAFFGIVVFFTLVPEPSTVGLPSPNITKAEDIPRANGEEDALLPTEESEGDPFEDNEAGSTPGAPVKPSQKPISFLNALRVPGVIEFSLSLFFAKLVSYTFLYWLPFYIKNSLKGATSETAGDLSTLFDVGGIPGAIAAGLAADITGSSALVCGVLILMSTPMMFVYKVYGSASYGTAVGLLMATGALVNGPYCLITTSVSADLGTHPTLKNSAKALSTVTAIIDGTGSIGAALGPLVAYLFGENFDGAFYMLIGANVMSLLLLSRLLVKDVIKMYNGRKRSTVDHQSSF